MCYYYQSFFSLFQRKIKIIFAFHGRRSKTEQTEAWNNLLCTIVRLLLENYLLASNIIPYMLTARFISLLNKSITSMISIPRQNMLYKCRRFLMLYFGNSISQKSVKKSYSSNIAFQLTSYTVSLLILLDDYYVKIRLKVIIVYKFSNVCRVVT